jgi:hypothetical protein
LFPVDACGINGDSFHVLAYYTTTSSQWRVTKCITCTGRIEYVSKKKGNDGKEGPIPPIAVGDLPPPPPNETVLDVFNDANVLGKIEEGNSDKAPCHPQVPIEEELTAILGKKGKKPHTTSPIKTMWILPLLHAAISQTPKL